MTNYSDFLILKLNLLPFHFHPFIIDRKKDCYIDALLGESNRRSISIIRYDKTIQTIYPE